MSTKTEQPTPRRRAEAKDRGEFARTRFFPTGLLWLAFMGAWASVAPWVTTHVQWWLAKLLATPLLPQAPSQALFEANQLVVSILAAPLVAAWLGAWTAGLSQTGGTFRWKWVRPQWQRISFIAGWKRLTSQKQLWGKLGSGLLIMAVLGAVVTEHLASRMSSWMRSLEGSPSSVFAFMSRELTAGVWKLIVACLVLGIGEWVLARWSFQRGLRMSPEEVRRELKQTEGPPQPKMFRRALHRQILLGGGARGIRDASVVVVNPTHLAVAFRYAPDECEAPYVTAKAQDDAALKLRDEALAWGIPVVRDVPLARGLIGLDVGTWIPEELYEAAAVVLRIAEEEQRKELAS